MQGEHAMKEKKFIICTWIHHIATFTGLFLGLARWFGGSRGILKRSFLGIFITGQLWAAVKVISSFFSGRCHLERSYDNIHKLSKSKKQEHTILCSLSLLSVLFKIGTPLVLSGEWKG